MKKVLTRLTTLPMGCLTLMLAAGCGDSLANGPPVDAPARCAGFPRADVPTFPSTPH